MPEDPKTLSQAQLKGRKVVGNQYRKDLEEEIAFITRYLSRIDLNLKTNPKIIKPNISDYTTAELEELKRIYSRVMLRVKGIEMKYTQQLKKIDQAITSK